MDDVNELKQQLRRLDQALERAEKTAAEVRGARRDLRARIAAATPQRRHRWPVYLRPLTLMPGLAAGGIGIAKAVMAILGRHKAMAAASTAATAAAVTSGSLVLITPPVQHEPHSPAASPPAGVAGPVPGATHTARAHNPHHPRLATAAQKGNRTVAPDPAPSVGQSPPIADAGEGAGQGAGEVNVPTPAQPRCITVTVGPLAKIKILCH